MQRDVGVAHELHTRPDAGGPREPLRRVVESLDRRALPGARFGEPVERAFERNVAVLVDQGREQPGQGHHRIRHRAAGHTRVLRTVERAQLDVGGRETAQ